MVSLIRFVTLRSLRTRKLRSILSILGIVLGVAGLLGIQLANLTALNAINRLFEDTAGQTDLQISSASSDSEGIPERILQRIDHSPGISLAVPTLLARTTLTEEETRSSDVLMNFFGTNFGGLSLYGIDPLLDVQVRGYKVTAGEFLSSELDGYEMVLVENYAVDHDIELDKWISILTPNGPQELRVVGLMAKEGPGQINNGSFGVIPLQTAQDLFNREGELDQVDILVETEQRSREEISNLKDQLQEKLGKTIAVTYPSAQGDRVAQMLDGYQIGLNFLSGMALFVGAFLIYNAFSMTVVERTREFGFLRTIGMTRRQVIFQVLIEAGLLGILGSGLGVAVGLFIARGLASVLGGLFDQDIQIAALPTDVLMTSLLVGVGVTFFAAIIPAWQAGRVSPLEAMAVRGRQREGWLMRYGWVLGTGLLLLATYILILNPFPYDVQFRLGSLTVSSLFLGATLVIPASVGIWDVIVRPMVRIFFGNSGRLGSSNISRAKLRTTLTVAALMVGVSMILITRGMTDSFKNDLESWIDAYIGGDLFVSSSVPMRNTVWRHVDSVDGVEAVAPIRYFTVRWDRGLEGEEQLSFMAIDPAAHNQVTSFVFTDSQQDPQLALSKIAAGNAVFVSSVLSEKYGLDTGDVVRLRTRGGLKSFEVAGVIVDFFNQGMVIQGNWADMQRYYRINDADILLLKVTTGYDVDQVRDQIEVSYGQRDHLVVVSNQSIIERALLLLRQSNSVFDVLALIAMFVGGLGVVNTLMMNVMERTQEIGMLRSIGMTRRQIVQMILAEAAMMGLIGASLGLILGVILTRIFLKSMTAMSGYKLTFVMPIQGVVVGLLVAIVVSQLAAILPARRAVRTPILDAIHYE